MVITAVDRRALRLEVLLVLAASLGQSAVYSAVSLAASLTAAKPLAQQQAVLNRSRAEEPWLDLTRQLLDIGFGLVPALLCVYLLARCFAPAGGPVGALGLRPVRPRFDLGAGAVLALCIGVPGLALYFGAHALGVNAAVVASGLPHRWWSVPVLVLAAAQNALLEEVVVVGYLLTRLDQFDVDPRRSVAASAVLRGSYHLYQGFGGFVGNAVMGVVFALFYRRYGRVGPLVVAHTILDIVAFVGYALFKVTIDRLTGTG